MFSRLSTAAKVLVHSAHDGSMQKLHSPGLSPEPAAGDAENVQWSAR